MSLPDVLAPFRLVGNMTRRQVVSWRPPGADRVVLSQAELARLADDTVLHRLRAGRTHRFIDILFVTVGDRVFCRRYTFGARSWYDVFQANPDGQLWLDGTVVDIEARVPDDLDDINPAVNAAYERTLRKIGASMLMTGAVEDRALASTMEFVFAGQPPSNA